jgi:alcohol dehydrogenase (cytochrome c)
MFKCKSLDGARTITFTGRMNGEEIVFTWEKAGSGNPLFDDALFGASAPQQFTAKRVRGFAGVPFQKLLEAADNIRKAYFSQKAYAVTFDRILRADQEPQNWLTYSGTVTGQRHSRLTQITPSNVKDLEMGWIWQAQSSEKFEATPLVVDGFLYTVQAPNDVVALDADTGRFQWTYSYKPSSSTKVCCGRVNRGLAILGGTLFMGTLDAHLLAIDSRTGKLIWDATVANVADPTCKGGTCYSITHAPLIVKDKVIIGVAGGDNDVGQVGSIRGFIAAFNVSTGSEAWRFYTIPGPGDPGYETWSGDSWKTGGGGIWNTGVYDPELNLTYWGTGNPSPDYDGNVRLGDNLYSNSVVALDADTGKLRWHYQFTPHDDKDRDSAQVPVLTDLEWQGRSRKVMLWANRNGIMYVLDRATGQFLMGKPFGEVNWMERFTETGRPITPTVTPEYLGDTTNWYPPSYSPDTGLFYIPVREIGRTRGQSTIGTIRAFDPKTGERKWEFKRNIADLRGGLLTTASGLLFTGMMDRYFYALDARSGEELWHLRLAGGVQSGPISYAVGDKQYIAVAAGDTLYAFALPQ